MHPRGSRTSLPPVQTQEFDGPLDLLLEEVRRQNVEIESIAMAPIVSRFLEYMATAVARNLNLDIDWLHMAATLIHWKSQSLLPSEPGGKADRDPIRDSIIQQLRAHRGQLGEELGRRHSLEQGRISRSVIGVAGVESSESDDPPFLCVWDMIQQARELARWVETHRVERSQWQDLEVERDDVTVSEMIEYLRAQVPAAERCEVDGVSLMRDQPTASRRACLFLGLLEMAQNRELHLTQDEGFGPIWISGAYAGEGVNPGWLPLRGIKPPMPPVAMRKPGLVWIAPATGRAGTTVKLELFGEDFQPEDRVQISGNGIQLGNVEVASATHITVSAKIAAALPASNREVSVVSATGKSNSLRFRVGPTP